MRRNGTLEDTGVRSTRTLSYLEASRAEDTVNLKVSIPTLCDQVIVITLPRRKKTQEDLA